MKDVKATFCWLAETKAPRGGYLQGTAPAWSGHKIAITITPQRAQKFRTKEGCQAFIDEWDEAKAFEPTEHGFYSAAT